MVEVTGCEERSSLLRYGIIYAHKTFHVLGLIQSYKPFYDRNRIFTFVTFQVLHSVGYWPYPQTLDKAEKASQGLTL